MAMVLSAFMSNFSRLLTKMAEEEVGMLLGIPGEIAKLEVTVRDIQCVLSDAERKRTKGSAIERWLLQLKDVMYDADDLIDLCQIKVDERRLRLEHPSSSYFGFGPCRISLLSCFYNPIFAHEIGTEIKKLNARLEEIGKKKSGLGLTELQDVVRPFDVHHRDSDIDRKTDPSVVLSDIVGDKIKGDTELLVKWLTTEEMEVNENVAAVAVVGMGGIGKTTLAKKVFNNPRIQEGFHLKVWVYVSKDLKGVELLKCIIRAVGGDHGAAEERSELVPMLERLVQGKKFFLVLDDVWPESQKVWDGLLRGPMIGGAHGSRLLVTTRDGRVAHCMKATKQCQVEKLSDEDAWSLLIKQVTLDDTKSEILDMKDIGIELVKKCEGLPLAIKTIGGVLRMKDKTRSEWQTVLRSSLWLVDGLPSDIHHAFYLSYEDLPPHLKQCFIFCSLYPEDFVFNRSQLVYLWLAEGFLCDEGDLSFLELGKQYYKELLLRNLLEVSTRYYDQDCCKMQDLLRSFAEYLGNGDNFIMREGALLSRCESFLKLRRISIEGHSVDEQFLNKEKSLRTLLLIDNPMTEFLPNVLSFPHLRIIDLFRSKISSLPDSFCDLVHLRYLNAAGSKLKALPNSIGNLRNLLYLNLGSCKLLSHLPSSISNLVQLRLLSLYLSSVETFPVGLRKLQKLVELHGFKPDKNCSKELSSLEDLSTLSKLSRLVLCSLEKASDIIIARKANLKEKVHLKSLSFFYTQNMEPQVFKSHEQKRAIENVINVLSPPPCLEILNINGYFGYHLPNWLNVGTNPSALKFLKFLELASCECFMELPPLGQLPNLELLRINSAISVRHVGREFFWVDTENHTRATVCHPLIVPFSQLNKLSFHRMSHWIQWQWKKGQPAMPKLKKLSIKACPQLSSLPKGLSHHATSLEFLDIEAAKSIRSIENLQSVKDIRVLDNPNLERISNLPSLSFILIRNCPNLVILENLKPFHRMELWDLHMETLPKYLKTTNPRKLTIWCRKKLLLKIVGLEICNSERQKFMHIPNVNIYAHDQSLYATYQKTPFSLTTNVDRRTRRTSSVIAAPSST